MSVCKVQCVLDVKASLGNSSIQTCQMYAHSPSEIYFFHGDRTSGNADSSNNAYYLLYHHAITT